MDGQIGDQQQVPVDVHQAGLRPMLRGHLHPPRQRQGPIQPGSDQHSAVALHAEAGVLPFQHAVFLQLERGPVGVSGGDGEAHRVRRRNTESKHGAAPTGEVILSALFQLPGFPFGQPGVAVAVQQGGQVGRRMIRAMGVVQEVFQVMDAAHAFASTKAQNWSICWETVSRALRQKFLYVRSMPATAAVSSAVATAVV